MYNFTTRLGIFIILLCTQLQLQSSHIVGGEISYQFVNHNTAQTEATIGVTLTLYRDPIGIDYDQLATFGIFRQDTNGQWIAHQVVPNVPIGPITNIEGDLDPCKTRNLDDSRMEIASYFFETTLEIGNSNYMVVYQKCCRNYTINNIIGGGNVGSVYDVIITPTALRLGSDGPVFTGTPPIFLCAGYDLTVDQSASDSEGDRLTYTLCTPLTPVDDGGPCGNQNPDPSLCLPPYNGVNYIPPFSSQNPMGGSPEVGINPSTGIMTGTPEEVGSYVVAICVEEFRNGVLLSKTRRDYEFNVITCEDNLVASIVSDDYIEDTKGNTVAYFQSCNELDFEFINSSLDEIYIENYTWQFFDKDNILVFEDTQPGNRDLSHSFDEPGVYEGLMILNDNATCYDTARILVNIIPEIDIQTAYVFDSCVAGAVTFQNVTEDFEDLDWVWDLGDGTVTTEPSPVHTYATRGSYLINILAVDTADCETRLLQTIDWNPYQLEAPDTVQLSELICHNDSIFIYDQWVTQAGLYYDYIPSLFNGCDSVVQKINVDFTIKPEVLKENIPICEGDSYYFNGLFISQAGTYLDTLISYQDCDSIVGIDVFILQPISMLIEQEICENETIIIDGLIIDSPGIYVDTLSSSNGCDSIVALQIYEVAEKETIIVDGFCSNSSYSYENDIITEPGIYDYTYQATSGCDSIVTLDLTMYEVINISRTEELCESGFTILGNDTISTTGIYTSIETTENGCDSITILDLTVLEESVHEFLDTICLGETYPFGSIDLTIPGIYYDTLQNQNGCDSLVILELIVGQNLTRIDVDEELEEEFGSTLILEPEVNGGDLINSNWFEVDEFISGELVLNYIVQDDNWIFFESTNDLFCVAIDSVFIRSRIDIDIYFPNVITPNGDGLNDLFNIGASETVLTSTIQIYDRWGNHIYKGEETNDRSIVTGWNGTYDGEPVQIGTYTYMVEVLFINEERKIYAGEVQVIK